MDAQSLASTLKSVDFSDWIALVSLIVSGAAWFTARQANVVAKQSAHRDLVNQKFSAEIDDLVLEHRYFKQACEPYNAGPQRDDALKHIDEIRRTRFDRAGALKILEIDTGTFEQQRIKLESVWDPCLDPGASTPITPTRRDTLLESYRLAHEEYSKAVHTAYKRSLD